MDEYVQLHEQIEIHYHVDCYAAQYWLQDGNRLAIEACAETIDEALALLNQILLTRTLEQWRRSTDRIKLTKEI